MCNNSSFFWKKEVALTGLDSAVTRQVLIYLILTSLCTVVDISLRLGK